MNLPIPNSSNTSYKYQELLEPCGRQGPARVKPADKMIMMQALFDGDKPEKAKQHCN